MPIIYEKKGSDGGQAGIWELSESWQEMMRLLELSAEDQEKVLSFKLESRRQEWLGARLLIKHFTGITPQIDYHANGMPFLKNIQANISISHTRHYAAVALHPSKKVAIDIEYPSERVLRISHRFIHPDEEKNLTVETRTLQLTAIWCAKETLFKWAGQTDVIFKEHLHTHPFTLADDATIDATICRNDNIHHLQLHLLLKPHYICVYTI
jgi:phosphopantetheinyl transferase